MPDPATHKIFEALGVAPFRLDGFYPPRDPSLFHWMVLVLVEGGRPMTMEAIVQRLTDLDVESNTGDLAYSLRKAWHGLKPVYQDSSGLFGLELADWHVGHIVRESGIVKAPETALSPVTRIPGDDDPVTIEEMEALCEGGISSSFSKLRATAALLECTGRALTIDEVNAWIGERLKYGTFLLRWIGVRGWRSDLVTVEGDKLVLNPHSRDLPAMRSAVHVCVHPMLVRKTQQREWERGAAKREVTRAVERQRDAAGAARQRRVILHLVPDPDEPAAGVILDVEARTFTTFTSPGDLPGARCLAGFDVVIGLDVRNALLALGVDPGPFRLIDLGPPQKTKKLSKSGRKLVITTDLLMKGSVGMSLGDPDRIARYIQEGDHRHLAARLESDAKSLYAYYMHGRLHGYLRLRWGFLDEGLPVDWRSPGEDSLHDILGRGEKEGREVEVVLGNAPGWEDPWSRMQVGVVRRSGQWSQLTVELSDRVVSPGELQAARLGRPLSSVEPAP